MADTVESMLARNCAPVLAGIKPSNLFSCPASCGIQLTGIQGHSDLFRLRVRITHIDIGLP